MVTFLFPFFFRARQACNQMQSICRNDKTRTDHMTKYFPSYETKPPFCCFIWKDVCSAALVYEWMALSKKRADVDSNCWQQKGETLSFFEERVNYYFFCSCISPFKYLQTQSNLKSVYGFCKDVQLEILKVHFEFSQLFWTQHHPLQIWLHMNAVLRHSWVFWLQVTM